MLQIIEASYSEDPRALLRKINEVGLGLYQLFLWIETTLNETEIESSYLHNLA